MNYLAQLNRTQLDQVSGSVGLKFWNQSIGAIVSAAVPYLFYFAGFALAIFIVLSGFSILTSKGDERAVAAAKAKLTYAIAGFLIIFSSYWVLRIVGRILNIQQIINIFG